MPLVGEAVNNGPGQAGAEGGFDLPFEHFAFLGLALAQAVHANFTQDQRLGVGDHLQAGQVILEGPLLVQIDVEADEIDVLRVQKLRRRIIAEGAKAFGIDPFGHLRQFVEKVLHRRRAAPADDVGRQFIDDAVGEDGGMAGAALHGGADGGAGFVLKSRRNRENRRACSREYR